MYGFTGLGTNSFGTSRVTTTGTLVRLATTILRGLYNVGRIITLL